MLRFFLAESRVRYAGDSGVRYHQMVVRAAPGGSKGFPLPKATAEQTVPVDVAAVKARLRVSEIGALRALAARACAQEDAAAVRALAAPDEGEPA